MPVDRQKHKTQTTTTSTPTDTSDIADLLPKGEIELLSPEALGMTTIETNFFQKYRIAIADAPKGVQTVHTRMLQYVKSMDVNVPIAEPSVGAQNQIYLFQTFMKALSQKDNDLFMAIDLVTAHIREGASGVFSDRMVYRFIKNIKRDAEEVQSYLKILEIFVLISNPLKRQEVVKSNLVRNAVGAIDPRFKDAAFSLVTYLSQE